MCHRKPTDSYSMHSYDLKKRDSPVNHTTNHSDTEQDHQKHGINDSPTSPFKLQVLHAAAQIFQGENSQHLRLFLDDCLKCLGVFKSFGVDFVPTIKLSLHGSKRKFKHVLHEVLKGVEMWGFCLLIIQWKVNNRRWVEI